MIEYVLFSLMKSILFWTFYCEAIIMSYKNRSGILLDKKLLYLEKIYVLFFIFIFYIFGYIVEQLTGIPITKY